MKAPHPQAAEAPSGPPLYGCARLVQAWNWVVSMVTEYLTDSSVYDGQSAARAPTLCCHLRGMRRN